MDFNPACLSNIFLALLALVLYAIGSYRFYRNRRGFTLILGLAIGIDILTAVLASLRVTPTAQLEGMERIPWGSPLFMVHIVLATAGFVGFILLFLYLLFRNRNKYSSWIRVMQFKVLLPVWLIGEGLALANAAMKLFFGLRLFV